MDVLKFKDWLKNKPQFSIRRCLHGSIVEVDRLNDSAEFALGPVPGTDIIIWDFLDDLIHVEYSHSEEDAESRCEINKLQAPDYTFQVDDSYHISKKIPEIDLKLVSVKVKGTRRRLNVKG